MSFFDDFLISINKEIIEKVEKLIEEKGIREKVAENAEKAAIETANRLLDPSLPQDVMFKGINAETDELDEYLLVLDYMESTGLKFASQTARFESQHPEITLDRVKLAEKYGLRSYDKTPLLIQLIEERLKTVGNEE